MIKIKKANELLWAFGIIFVALGVAICNKSNLGVSMIAAPAFIISEFLSSFSQFFSVGVTEYIMQGVILVVLCCVIRKFDWRFLLTFVVAVIYGYTLDLFLWLLEGFVLETVTSRWICLIIGDMITAFGVACFFRTYMPLQVYELFVSQISKKFKFKLTKVKSLFDISLLFISITFALTLFDDTKEFAWIKIGYISFHNLGLGTIVTTVINAPLIAFAGKFIDKNFDNTPRFKKIEMFLKSNEE